MRTVRSLPAVANWLPSPKQSRQKSWLPSPGIVCRHYGPFVGALKAESPNHYKIGLNQLKLPFFWKNVIKHILGDSFFHLSFIMPKWCQNHPNIMPKSSNNYPKMILKTSQNHSTIIPKWSQNDPKNIPKSSKNDTNMIPQSSKNDTKIIPKSF